MYATLGMIKVYFPDNIVFSMLIHSFIQKKKLPLLSLLLFLLLKWIIGSLGCHQKNWWVYFATESYQFKGIVSFFTDYKHTLFLNGSTDPISAGKRYDKLLLDLNNNYVLSAKKHSCHERFAVLRLRSKTRKLKSTKIKLPRKNFFHIHLWKWNTTKMHFFVVFLKLEIFFQNQDFYILDERKNRLATSNNANGGSHGKTVLRKGEEYLKGEYFT